MLPKRLQLLRSWPVPIKMSLMLLKLMQADRDAAGPVWAAVGVDVLTGVDGVAETGVVLLRLWHVLSNM